MSLLDQRTHSTMDLAQVPGIDIVLPIPNEQYRLLDVRAQKLVGALHRRFWSRRCEMVRNPPTLEQKAGNTWEERLQMMEGVSNRLEANERQTVELRSWASSEPGVLVDGRVIAGCVFDLAVVASMAVDSLRRGEQPVDFALTISGQRGEDLLWQDMFSLAEDRLGLDRNALGYALIIDALVQDVA